MGYIVSLETLPGFSQDGSNGMGLRPLQEKHPGKTAKSIVSLKMFNWAFQAP